MEHHTDDLGARAQDIAQKELDRTWEKTHNGTESAEVFNKTMQSVLLEAQNPFPDDEK